MCEPLLIHVTSLQQEARLSSFPSRLPKSINVQSTRVNVIRYQLSIHDIVVNQFAWV